MHDPRKGVRISERDIAALTFIGEGYEIAQYQLHFAVFSNVSAFVVSRFVTRGVRNGWIAVERWNRVGMNLLRLTRNGRDLLISKGGDEKALFAPRRAVATKDLSHTLWINDLRAALRAEVVGYDAILPAWQLQRRLSPPPPAIPDLLAIKKATGAGFVCAVEIDLGGERLTNVFVPKLRKLADMLSEWSGKEPSALVILTVGKRRAAVLRDICRAMGYERRMFVVEELPTEKGAAALGRVQRFLRSVETQCLFEYTLADRQAASLQ
jgi:hypothetical protein